MEKTRNIPLSVSLLAALKVAIMDTLKNFFRPWHNAKVIFGYEKEPSLSAMLRAEEDKIMQRRKALTAT